MAARNLYRQAQPFRWLGWGLYLTGLWLLPESAVDSQARTLGLTFGGLAAAALPFWGQFPLSSVLRVERRGLADDAVVSVLRLELLLMPSILAVLQLPLVVVLTVTLALTIANLALLGRQSVAWSIVGSVLGALCWLAALVWSDFDLTSGWRFDGAVLRRLVPTPSATDVRWLTALCMLAVFCAGLACVAFRIAQKLDAHRRLWRERAALLTPFVPPGLLLEQPQQDRRWFCVVMVDVLDFTNQSAPLAPETVSTVLDDLLDATVRQAANAGGTLDKFLGDGALLFFTGATDTPSQAESVAPDPDLFEGDVPSAERPDRLAHRQAVQSALRFVDEMRAELPMLNSRWQVCGVAERLQLRFGVASGYCSLGQRGRASVRAYTLVGRCVGLAQRLQQLARPDSLTLCPVSARLIAAAGIDQREPRWPRQLTGVRWDGSHIRLTGRDERLRGFPLMRVYRPSDKVHAPSL